MNEYIFLNNKLKKFMKLQRNMHIIFDFIRKLNSFLVEMDPDTAAGLFTDLMSV